MLFIGLLMWVIYKGNLIYPLVIFNSFLAVLYSQKKLTFLSLFFSSHLLFFRGVYFISFMPQTNFSKGLNDET